MINPPMRHRRQRKLKAEINVVPYIDVMLVLLVTFMVTAPLLNLGIDVKLPQVNASTVEPPKRQIVVQVGQDGGLSLIQTDIEGSASKVAIARDELVARVSAYRESDPDLVVFVAGDGAVRYESVLGVLQLLRNEAKVPRATLLAQSTESTGK